jgi:uncharacterized protein YcbX
VRPTDQAVAPGGQSSFADGFPLLVAFTGSLDDLNRKIAENGGAGVTMDRFRPNIVIESDTPWQEDTIGRVRAGELELSLVKPCGRCVVTTIDQAQGKKAGGEPLKTLATFRFSRPESAALFAENAVPHGTGTLKVGDALTVLSAKPAPVITLKAKKEPGKTI